MNPSIRDILERVVWTAIQAFSGSLLASPLFEGLGLDWKDALKVAAVAAGASILKNIVALNIGGNSPQAMPGGTYEYPVDVEVTP